MLTDRFRPEHVAGRLTVEHPEGARPRRFREMVIISDRPADIDDRAVPGPWEGDLIIGSTASRSAIGTRGERTAVTRCCCTCRRSPWQRGRNENTDGLLREYCPKSTELSFPGPGILENVNAELNRRPRKRPGHLTPAEVLATLLSNSTNQTGVADTTFAPAALR